MSEATTTATRTMTAWRQLHYGGPEAVRCETIAVPAPRRGEVRQVLDTIATDPAADLSVAALARGAGLSERHLARMFRAETGTTVGEHVEAVRVDVARRLLESENTSIGMVARRCGFGTVETFHRAFKRRTGITPGEHRARFA